MLHRARHFMLLLPIIVLGCETSTEVTSPRAAGTDPATPAVHAIRAPRPEDLSHQWCALLAPGADPHALADANDLIIRRYLPAHRLVLFEGEPDPETIESLDDVLVFERNQASIWGMPVELTLGFSQGEWDEGEATGQVALAPLHLSLLHGTTTGDGVHVAVLDTGVEPNHPHLLGRVDLVAGGTLGSVETPNGVDDDGNGTVDDAYGHGTHVAGTILQIAPASRILSIRVLNEEGWGTVFDLAAGLSLANALHVDIVNLSLVLTAPSSLIEGLLVTLDAAHIPVLAAAGNQGGVVAYPASSVHALSVAATNLDNVLASFSGAWPALLAAPGVSVASSYQADKLAYGTGTSMATAVASGSMAAALAYYRGLGISSAVAALTASALPIMPGGAVTHGRVRPLKAVDADLPLLAP